MAVLAGCAVVVLAVRSTPVRVTPAGPPASVVKLCRALQAKLPATVDGQRRRDTRPASPLTAAWGSPAITLRCGVERPSFAATATLAQVDDISWLPVPEDDPDLLTALGREAYITVHVPGQDTPPANALADLTPAINAAVPANPGGSL
jgi:hypothetical protein